MVTQGYHACENIAQSPSLLKYILDILDIGVEVPTFSSPM
jgi:hypothetical protein